MQIIGASRVFLCNDDFDILDAGGIVFDEKIIEVGDFEFLKSKYSNLQNTFYENAVLLPTFTNPHIHFEFSANKTDFCYGDFSLWLSSVMQKRDKILEDKQSIQEAIDEQLKSGVGAVGAISSYGFDLELLAQSPLRVVYFNEVIGSNPAAVDFLYSNFLKRLEDSQNFKNQKFQPAIAIHSPYSVHYVLAKKALDLARHKNFLTSVHFLESVHERNWLDNEGGWFEKFYQETLGVKNPTSLYTASEFLDLFEGFDTLFVHTLFANLEERQKMLRTGHVITCPRSNRLLNNQLLDIDGLCGYGIGTDGKSSNFNLNYLDELRAMLFGYKNKNCLTLAKEILKNATFYGARALRINSGRICENFNADFSIFDLHFVEEKDQEALQFILHAKAPKKIFISGRDIFYD